MGFVVLEGIRTWSVLSFFTSLLLCVNGARGSQSCAGWGGLGTLGCTAFCKPQAAHDNYIRKTQNIVTVSLQKCVSSNKFDNSVASRHVMWKQQCKSLTGFMLCPISIIVC